jgi:hypothetical protein
LHLEKIITAPLLRIQLREVHFENEVVFQTKFFAVGKYAAAGNVS